MVRKLTQHQSDFLLNGYLEFIAACGDVDKIGVGGCKFQFKLSRFIMYRAFNFGYTGRDDGGIGIRQCWFGFPIRVLENDLMHGRGDIYMQVN